MTELNLQLVHSENPLVSEQTGRIPKLTISKSNDNRWAIFHFETLRNDFYVQSQLPKNASADGLWNSDVYEVFLSEAPTLDEVQNFPYLEFQVSPLGQYFELRVIRPRIEFDPLKKFHFQVHSEVSNTLEGQAWVGEIRIDLSFHHLHWPLIGNAFAILGKAGGRNYYSAFTPPQSIPDFHIPSHFSKFSEN